MTGNIKRMCKIAYRHWMKFAGVLGEINYRIIFSIFYFFLIGAYAISRWVWIMCFRKSLKHPYPQWEEKQMNTPDIKTMRRQF